MGKKTDVLLITGFLGSGKTTFLNRLIQAFPADRRLMVLMNEFGEVGVDGCLLPDRDLELVEISRGSVFCACVKTDFIKALARIASDIQPDLLVIEATGVANPTDLKRDLKLPLFRDRFLLKEQICFIDVPNFLDAFSTFVSVERQLESSTTVVFNKLDRARPGQLGEVKATVRKHLDSSCVCLESRFADVPLGPFLPDAGTAPGIAGAGPDNDPDQPGEAELRAAIEESLNDPSRATAPAEGLFSAVYDWTGRDLEKFSELAAKLPAGLLRAKGLLRHDGRTILFNWVPGDFHLEPVILAKDQIGRCNRVVFVGARQALEELATLARAGDQLSFSLFLNPMQNASPDFG